jgi:hypothetical protein
LWLRRGATADTYYMPRDRRPCRFGMASAVSAGLIEQVLFPFRRG